MIENHHESKASAFWFKNASQGSKSEQMADFIYGFMMLFVVHDSFTDIYKSETKHFTDVNKTLPGRTTRIKNGGEIMQRGRPPIETSQQRVKVQIWIDLKTQARQKRPIGSHMSS